MAEQSKADWTDYEERLVRVLQYIHDHLDGELDLNRIAEVACYSPFHWHRLYRAMVGEPVLATVRRLRMHHAAGQLLRSGTPIREIAARSGFSGVQAFTRAFREAFGIPPAEYREGDQSMEYRVEITNLPAATAFTCEHIGPYMKIGRAFDQIHAWLAIHGPGVKPAQMVALYYDDPLTVPEEQLRSRAGFILAPGESLTSPFEPVAIQGGPHAVLVHKGPYAELTRAYQWLYGEWLPHSGRIAADAPVFEEYLNTPLTTPPQELLTKICLPLV